MNKAADKPLYRQFRPMLAAIFLCVILLLPLVLTLAYLNEHQQADVQREQLQDLKWQNQSLLYRQQNHTLFTQLLTERHAGQFALLYQRLVDNWQTLMQQLPANADKSDAVRLAGSELFEEVKRLAANSQRNLQLKQQTVIQLQLVSDALDAIIFSRQQQLDLLSGQLQADQVGDAVTVSRAGAQGKIYQQLARYYRLENLLLQLQLLFKRLDLQLPLSEFDELRLNADELLRFADELKQGQGADIQLMTLTGEIDKLSLLLQSEQRTLAKWQGHLRLAHEFREILTVERDKIQALLTKPFDSSEQQQAEELQGLSAWLLAQTRGQPLFFAVSVCAVLALAVCLLLFRLYWRLKTYDEQNLRLCKQLTAGEAGAESLITSLESSRFARLIGMLNQPVSTVQELKRISQGYKVQLKTLAQLNQVLYWQQDGEFTLAQQLIRGSKYLFNQAVTVGSWRHAFPREEVKKLLVAAREVKKSGERQNIQMYAHSGELLTISLLYRERERHFCGTAINADNIAGYEQALELANREQEAQQLMRRQQAQTGYRQLAQLLAVAEVQVQSLSCGGGATPRQLHRQLGRVSDWLSRHRLLTSLREKQPVMTLRDVHLVNEIHAAVYNLAPQARLQQNRLVLDCDPALISRVKLDVHLFHELLIALSRLMLTGIFKGQLTFTFKVRDKQPGQQGVEVSAEVVSSQAFSRLPVLLEMLNDNGGDGNGPADKVAVEYLRLLLACLHGRDSLAELTEGGYRLVIELPLAQADTCEPIPDSDELMSLNLLCLSEQQEMDKQLGDLLKPLRFESCTDGSELLARLTPGQLKTRPADLVMVSEQAFAKEAGAFEAHLNNLPDALRPKLLVLQSEGGYARELGLYSPAGYLLSRQSLWAEIRALMQQKANNNLLLSLALCRQYAFARSEVEVLLAVEEPGRHLGLIGLLHWLGLEVHVAANAATMQQLWQSGRFLLLVAEFELPDFADLDQGKAFERGLFCLPGNPLPADRPEIKGWQVADFPELSNLAAVVALLRPWLNVKEGTEKNAKESSKENVKERNGGKVKRQELMPAMPMPPAVSPDDNQGGELAIKEEAGYGDELQALALEQQLSSLSGSDSEAPPAFDLLAYTRHQSSAELAVYMLDNYLADNRDYLAQLRVAFQSRHFHQAERILDLLRQNASILAADKLFDLCRQMQDLSEQKALQQAEPLLEKTRRELEAIEIYAESI